MENFRAAVFEDMDVGVFEEDDDGNPIGIVDEYWGRTSSPLFEFFYLQRGSATTRITLAQRPFFGGRAQKIVQDGRVHEISFTTFIIRRHRGHAHELFPPKKTFTIILKLAGEDWSTPGRPLLSGDQWIGRHAVPESFTVDGDGINVTGSGIFLAEYLAPFASWEKPF